MISIILPMHNAAATITGAVESCLDQTHRDLELIVVDDASTDSPCLPDDARLHLYRSEIQLGVAGAFQLGLNHAQGEFIARMDADDINHPERLEKQLALLQAHPELDAVSCLVEICKRIPNGNLAPAGDGYQRFARWLNRLTAPDALARERFIDQPLVNPSMLLRREVFAKHGSYRTQLDWAEDYDFWLRLFHAGIKIAKVPETLFTWTDHPSRLTRTHHDYTPDAFTQCKAHYLSILPRVQAHGIIIGGAGPIGKAMAKALRACGSQLHHFYDVHPRRIGQTIHDLPVHSLDSMQPNRAVVLGAVGLPGKRGELRDTALSHGYTEGEDFFSVA